MNEWSFSGFSFQVTVPHVKFEWGNRYRRLNRPNGKKTYDNGEDSGSYILTQNHTLYILEREREREKRKNMWKEIL
jgi:hypothetical protein